MAKITDHGGLTDNGVSVELSSERVVPDTDRYADQMAAVDDVSAPVLDLPALPDRPADNAAHEKWVDYCVALGADRVFLENETAHYVSGTGVEPVPNPPTVYVSDPYTTAELKELADNLGG